MEKHVALVLLGLAGILVGLATYSNPDTWTRSWGLISLQAGAVFFAVGLGSWSIVEAIRDKRQ